MTQIVHFFKFSLSCFGQLRGVAWIAFFDVLKAACMTPVITVRIVTANPLRLCSIFLFELLVRIAVANQFALDTLVSVTGFESIGERFVLADDGSPLTGGRVEDTCVLRILRRFVGVCRLFTCLGAFLTIASSSLSFSFT